jgi:hypothetical protein
MRRPSGRRFAPVGNYLGNTQGGYLGRALTSPGSVR